MIPTLTLACGPYIDVVGFWISLGIFLLIKPLVYFGFIQAFRFRVSAAIPMSFGRAIKLTLMRTGLGVLIFLGGWAIVMAFQDETGFIISWIYLYIARIGAWWFVGAKGAKLKGRRLLGWIISGWLINVAFDMSVVFGTFAGVENALMFVGGILVCLVPLHLIGRRASLKDRFTLPLCAECNYNLTGNLSGVCPECGTVIGVVELA